jgi:outer membrane lipoprotein carrier protein
MADPHQVGMKTERRRGGIGLLWRWLMGFTLGLLLVGVAQAAGAVQDLHRFFQDTHTVTADFSQEIANAQGEIIKRASGRLWVSRPGKFRWDYAGANGQVIVSNGERVWLYEPALQQVTVQPLGKSLGSTPAALIAGRDTLDQDFKVKALPAKAGLQWVLLEPKEGQTQGFTSLRLGFDGRGQLREMRMEDAFSQTTLLRFTKVRVNAPVAAHVFQFVPPKGVDVLSNP